MEHKIKIIKKGEKYYIKLPAQFCTDNKIQKHKTLVGNITKQGKLELSVPISRDELCEICRKNPHRNNECLNCKKLVCKSCFWEMGRLCHDCLGKGEGQ